MNIPAAVLHLMSAKQQTFGNAKQPTSGIAKQPTSGIAKQPTSGIAKQPTSGIAKQPTSATAAVGAATGRRPARRQSWASTPTSTACTRITAPSRTVWSASALTSPSAV